MALIAGILGPVMDLIDKIIPNPRARDAAKLELLKLQDGQEMEALRIQLSALVAEANSADALDQPGKAELLIRDVCHHPMGDPDGADCIDMATGSGRHRKRHERISNWHS